MDTTSVSFRSFVTGHGLFWAVLRSHSLLCVSFPSLRLSKLKRLLALQRESCQPSCPLIKQILGAHTRTDVCAQRCLSISLSLSLSAFLAPLFKVKYVLRQPLLMPGEPWITAVQEGAEPPNQTINWAPERPARFHLIRISTHTLTRTLVQYF